MKVVLLEDIENLGRKYQVKEVKDGYARNFLLPKGLVKLADEKTLKWAEEEKETAAQKAVQDLEKIGQRASSMDGLEVEVSVKVGEEGQLFEKVNAQKISAVLKEMGYNIEKKQIDLKEPIGELGEYEVKIKFEHNLETQIKLIVVEQV